MIRRIAGVLVLMLVLAAGLSTAASAHASLIGTTISDGAMLAKAPERVTLTFNEPVTPVVLQLTDAAGQAHALAPAASGTTIQLVLPSLSNGTHVISWRVVSADGHPVGGALVFSVGHQSRSGETGIGTPLVVIVAIWMTRVLLYAGLFIGVGGAFYLVWSDERSRAEALVRLCLRAGLVTLLPALALQGVDLLGANLSAVFQASTWRAALASSYAVTIALAGIAFALAMVLMRIRPHQAPGRLLAAVMLLLATAAPAASGHASAASPVLLMRPAVWVHVLAVALWIGSLWPLHALLGRPDRGLSALRRFGRPIPIALLALVGSGVVLAIVQIAAPDRLTTTGYGALFLVKMGLVTVLLAIAAHNRFVLTRQIARGEPGATPRLQRTIRAELLVIWLIAATVAMWRFTPPPRTMATDQPLFTHIHTAAGMADLTVTPGRAGPVTVEIKLLRPDFTDLPAKAVELSLANAGLGIEPFTRSARLDPDGLWRLEGMPLPAPGQWQARIAVLVSDFDQIRLETLLSVPR
jgi:copper transport protein